MAELPSIALEKAAPQELQDPRGTRAQPPEASVPLDTLRRPGADPPCARRSGGRAAAAARARLRRA